MARPCGRRDLLGKSPCHTPPLPESGWWLWRLTDLDSNVTSATPVLWALVNLLCFFLTCGTPGNTTPHAAKLNGATRASDGATGGKAMKTWELHFHYFPHLQNIRFALDAFKATSSSASGPSGAAQIEQRVLPPTTATQPGGLLGHRDLRFPCSREDPRALGWGSPGASAECRPSEALRPIASV